MGFGSNCEGYQADLKAGDGIRTRDFQLGKMYLTINQHKGEWCKRNIIKSLQVMPYPSLLCCFSLFEAVTLEIR